MNLTFGPEAPLALRLLADAALVTHIAGGTVGILSGAVAMTARKGRRLHAIAGTVFFVAMLAMAGIAVVVAPMLPDDPWTNTTAAAFTLYLIGTAWAVVRRRPNEVGLFEQTALIVPLGIAIMALALRLAPGAVAEDLATITIFGVISALAVVCDLRMLWRGGVAGPDRTARHLWRMSAAFFVATGSFFIGQPDFQPTAIRGGPIPLILGLAPLPLLVFWMIRVKFARAFRPRMAGV